ncbi:MAG TPA: TetR/AcrR family transcriptional regulator [Thermoplasmata archaeon]|nr:TetR/AcrR family transcriptional regulator [Thermoplasmata archaeon]
MTRDRVIDEALQLADQEGFQALSMPALARRLHCGTMTLYGYVQDKDDLLDSVVQRGLEGIRLRRPLPSSTSGILMAWGRALRSKLHEHPALAGLLLSRAVIGPGILFGVEALLAALRKTHMDPAEGVPAVYAVLIYTTGFVAWETPRTLRQPPLAYAAAWRRLFEVVPTGSAPIAQSVASVLIRVAGESQFEAGLTALASGLESHISRGHRIRPGR